MWGPLLCSNPHSAIHWLWGPGGNLEPETLRAVKGDRDGVAGVAGEDERPVRSSAQACPPRLSVCGGAVLRTSEDPSVLPLSPRASLGSWGSCPPLLHAICSPPPPERSADQISRPAHVLRAHHHRPGHPGLHRVGLPSGGRGPPAQEQPVQGRRCWLPGPGAALGG